MKKSKQFIFIIAFGLIISSCGTVKEIINENLTGQQKKTFKKEIVSTIELDYLLYLPQDYFSKQDWPLMIFLHGAGERGADLKKVIVHGPPKIVENKKDFPFVLVSPQCPENEWWTNKLQTESLIHLIDQIIQDYNVDPKRVYLTGLSMGGYATWNLASLYPEKFAAIAPICGGGDVKYASVLKDIPIWVFHGAKDQVVPISSSQEMVDAIKLQGGNIQFTIYPEANHDSWTETYNNPELYKWFLSNSK